MLHGASQAAGSNNLDCVTKVQLVLNFNDFEEIQNGITQTGRKT